MKWMNAIFLLISMTLLMMGCTIGGAAESEPAAIAQPSMIPGGALATVAATAVPTITLPPTNTPAPTLASATVITSSVVTGAPVSPVTVDLSQITPAPPVASTPIEMPRPGVPNPLVAMEQKVKQDLAERLRQDISAIQLVSAEAVEWSDRALGCPDGNFAYASVITPGFKIILSAAGIEYSYHTDQQDYFVLCVNGKPASK